MAKDSGVWKCAGCGKSNSEIMQEREESVKEIEEKEEKAGKKKDEEVPKELRLAYRDELGKKEGEEQADKVKGKTVVASAASPSTPVAAASVPEATTTTPVTPVVRPTRTMPAPPLTQVAPRSADLAWIDTCIYGVVVALLFMVLKRFV
jgi:ubiquitin-conjugating enzyme E2 J1